MSIFYISFILFQYIFLDKEKYMYFFNRYEWIKIIEFFPIALIISKKIIKFFGELYYEELFYLFPNEKMKSDILLGFNISVFILSHAISSIICDLIFGFSFKSFYISILFSFLALIISILEIKSRVQKVVDEINDYMPFLIGQIYIYISSGVTLNVAFKKISEKSNNFLNLRISEILVNYETNKSFLNCIDEFMKESKIKNIMRLKNCFITFIKVGNKEAIENFKNLERDMIIELKENIKRRGEKIKVKMVFPLILFFLSLLIILVVPAFIMLI